MRKDELNAQMIYLLILGGAILWIAAIFLAPYLKVRSPMISNMIYAVFSSVCHQVPSRCFTFCGHPLAVCARCLGIYFGFLVGAGVFPLFRSYNSSSLPRAKTFILISLPIAFDTLGALFSLWKSPGILRFTTGFIWGSILPFYLIVGLTGSFSKKKRPLSSDMA